jgi:hypothetical protein
MIVSRIFQFILIVVSVMVLIRIFTRIWRAKSGLREVETNQLRDVTDSATIKKENL